MRTDAVIAIVGAHDARTAASRLTTPVSDETAGPGSWPGGGRQLTPVLLGVG